MSCQADTISTLVDTVQRWKASHDALVAENQRLRDALEKIIEWPTRSEHGGQILSISHALLGRMLQDVLDGTP